MSDKFQRARRRRAESEEPDLGRKADEDGSFLSQIRQNPFLAKEEKYLRENRELEKKSSELFEKIEQFSSKSRLRGPRRAESLYEGGGDRDRDSGSEVGADDSISTYGDTGPSTRSISFQGFEDDDEVLGYGGGDRRPPDRNKTPCDPFDLQPSFSASKLSRKLVALSSSASEVGGQGPGRSRLQRATESVIKSLQSKLINHEERLADLHLQYRSKIQENTMLESKIKALEEERERLLKTIGSLQQTVERHAKSAESSKSNLSLKVQTVTSMKKELEDLKRETKQSRTALQSLQTRLHRSMEDNERLKTVNKSVNQHLRETQAAGRQKADEQHGKIIDLEKQRSALNSTIAKQAQLIKLLKDKNAHHSQGHGRSPQYSAENLSHKE